MSGVIRYTQEAVAGAGINGIRDDNGNIVYPAAGGTVWFIGGPGVSIDQTNPNELTVSTATIAALFRADDGNDSSPDANNRITLLGGRNIHTVSDEGSQIWFHLDDNVDIPGNLVVRETLDVRGYAFFSEPILTLSNIVHTTDDATASVVFPWGIFQKATLGNTDDRNRMVLYIYGTISFYLNSYIPHSGVAMIGDSGILGVSRGENGQVLVGRTGDTPVWSAMTSLDNSVTITRGEGTIDFSVNGFQNLGLFVDDGAIYPAPNALYLYGTEAQGIRVRRENANTARISFADTLTCNNLAVDHEITATDIGTATLLADSIEANNFTFNAPNPSERPGVLCRARNNVVHPANSTEQGQVLISRGQDNIPMFNRLTAGAGINITQGDGNVTVSATGGGGGGLTYPFKVFLEVAQFRLETFMSYGGPYYRLGGEYPFSVSHDPYGVFAANGIFTAPVSGLYSFTVNATFARSDGYKWVPYGTNQRFGIEYRKYTPGQTGPIINTYRMWVNTNPGPRELSGPFEGTAHHSTAFYVIAGGTMRFYVVVPRGGDQVGLVDYLTNISGFKIG